MNLASIRLVTNDLPRLMAFYTTLTGVVATQPNSEFAELRRTSPMTSRSTSQPPAS